MTQHTAAPWTINSQGNVWRPPQRADDPRVLICRVVTEVGVSYEDAAARAAIEKAGG